MVELFEARQPKGKAPIAEATGRVKIEDSDRLKKIIITPDDGADITEFSVSRRARLLVEDGDHVEVGQQLAWPCGSAGRCVCSVSAGSRNTWLTRCSRSTGPRALIHDKRIEIIIRQMLRRVTVIESGDSSLLAGDLVDRLAYEAANRHVVAEVVRQPRAVRS